MSKVKLTYFNARALGEAARMLLAYGGEDFEDVRIELDDFDTVWQELKPKTPFGVLPVLEMDGVQYSQSVAIARFLGRKHGLAGTSLVEDLIIDQNVDFFKDLILKACDVQYEEDEKVRERNQEENLKKHYPFMLPRLNELITKNGGHIALGKLTWGDFVFAGAYDYLKMMLRIPDLDEQYPAFKQLQDRVRTLPGVKEFVAKAPVTVC